MQNPEIVIIGAAIIDVLAYPVNAKVFEAGSYSTEDIGEIERSLGFSWWLALLD